MRIVAGTLVVAALALLGTSRAGADPSSAAWKKFKGQIVVSDRTIPNFDTDKAMIDGLRKLNKTTLTKKDGEESWSLVFMGFLNKKVNAGTINLVFYKVTGAKREYMSNKEITLDADSNIVQADLEVSEEDNITAGNKYDVVLGRMVNGKETVFAKTKLSFVSEK